MEVYTEEPKTGTHLRFDIDRPFDAPTGDSVMTMQGEVPDRGSFETHLVELQPYEGKLLAYLLRQISQPSLRASEHIAQEIHALFPAKLSARDAAQLAQVVTKAQWQTAQQQIGIGEERETEHQVAKLAERFERLAAKQRSGIGAMPVGTNRQDWTQPDGG